MTVTVLLFATYADLFGAASVQVSLPPGATVRDLIRRLTTVAGGERLPPTPLVAVNQRYARSDHPLEAGDEVAVIPPVAGG